MTRKYITFDMSFVMKYSSVTLILLILKSSMITTGEKHVESKIVRIAQGSVRGYKNADWGIIEFFGIPYATTPTGPNKFKAPLPAPVWLETLDAVDKNVACPQVIMKGNPYAHLFADLNIVEDNCLIANIFVPDTQETNLSVFVSIHGGGYQMGNGNMMTFRGLVKEGNIIVVTFNYRLSVHGFLCLGTEDAPGNAGMKDQLAALRWVKKNIVEFGGNPDDVTIGGGSAGSSAVELLALSEITEGLFKRVIPESGAGVGTWSVQQDPLENAKSFAKLVNFESEDLNALEEFYKTTPLEVLYEKDELFRFSKDSTFFFAPCVEGHTGPDKFLKQAPTNILKNGNFKKFNMLIGFANMEGIINLNNFEEYKDLMNENFSDFLPGDLTFESEALKNKVATIVKEFYFGNANVTQNTMQAYINYFTDVMIAYPTMRSVKGQVDAGNNNIYLYEYSYVDNETQAMNPYKIRGANHCAQSLIITENNFFNMNESLQSENYNKFQVLMKQLWINFIKTGKPVPVQNAAFPDGWPVSSASSSYYMDLNIQPELKENLLVERAKFWDGIYERYYSTPKAPPSPSAKRSEQTR